MNRDNHAGKLSTIGWIAGFFDGEGYIGLWKRTDQRVGYKDTYRPSVVICNNHKGTIDYLSEQLKLFEVPHYIKYRPSKKVNWAESWVIEINGFKRIQKFIELVHEHCVTKKEQVSLVKEFIDRRAASYKNVPYIAREHEIYELLKLLKRA